MIRIINTVLALTMLTLSIVAFIKAVKGKGTMETVISFFLLVISVLLSFFVAMDVYMTVQLLFEFCFGEMGLTEKPVYPASARLWGIWGGDVWYMAVLDFFCIVTIIGTVNRKKIPGLFARDGVMNP